MVQTRWFVSRKHRANQSEGKCFHQIFSINATGPEGRMSGVLDVSDKVDGKEKGNT